MSRAPRLQSRRWSRPALAAASLVLTLALLELGSYLLGPFRGPVQSLQVGNISLLGSYDPLLFWRLEPGRASEDGRLWINAHGLRGPEIGEKKPGEYRILSLGESTTFAAQMPYGDSYSAVLERKLAARGGTREARVLNAGVPGYSLLQGYVYLRNRSAVLEPDMVLLYFGFNDFLPVAYLAERTGRHTASDGGRNDWELFEHRRQPTQRLFSWLMLRSNLFRGLTGLVSRRSAEGLVPNEYKPRVPEAHRRRLLALAKGYTERAGIELVLVVPVYAEFEGHAPLLREFAERESVTLVDLPRLLSAQLAGRSGLYFLDAVHPSPRGHRLIAEAIFEAIEEGVPR